MRLSPVALPRFLMDAGIPTGKFIGILSWLLPYIQKLETQVRPRRAVMFSPGMTRFLDIWIAVISLSVLVPLPFTAMFPAAVICLIAIGRMERDGVLVQIGSLIGVIAVSITIFVVFLTSKGIFLILFSPVAGV